MKNEKNQRLIGYYHLSIKLSESWDPWGITNDIESKCQQVGLGLCWIKCQALLKTIYDVFLNLEIKLW